MSPERLCAQLNGDPKPLGIFVEHGRGKGIGMLFHQQIGVGSTHGKQRHTPEQRAKRHPFSFMPFGLGPRNCIGMRLTQVEIRMMIASILQQYTPVLCEKSVFPPVFKTFTTIPKDGLGSDYSAKRMQTELCRKPLVTWISSRRDTRHYPDHAWHA